MISVSFIDKVACLYWARPMAIFCTTTSLAMKFREIVTGVGVINVKFFKFNIKFQLFACSSVHKRLVNSQVKTP